MSGAGPDRLHVLGAGTMELEGRLLSASNATFVGTVSANGTSLPCVYKPVRGERPLWDFPDRTLARRERAAYLVAAASAGTGAPLVPPTVLRDGPFGAGMCQLWVEQDVGRDLVDVVPAGEPGPGWLHILDAEDQHRQPVSLVHRDDPALQRMATLDVVINNADRKGGHVLVDEDGGVFGVDHGVCFHAEDKLRTVLWGWAGLPLPDACTDDLRRLRSALGGDLGEELATLLEDAEQHMLVRRVDRLLADPVFPRPGGGWPAIPWPAF